MGELLRALAQEELDPRAEALKKVNRMLCPPVVSFRRGLLNSGTALKSSRLGFPDAPLGYLSRSISGICLLVN